MQVYWLQQSERDVPPDDGWLTAGEAARLAAMRFPKRRADWRLGRWTGKNALASYLAVAIDRIEIRSAASGAPEPFVDCAPAPAAISLSHRDGTALCVVGPARVALGCDLEIIEPRSEAFASDYFTDAEQALLAGRSTDDRLLLLALLWSAKECVLKALGEGLRLDTRSVSVEPQLAGDGCWLPLTAQINSRSFSGWWQQAGGIVRTLVTDLPAGLPEQLSRSRSVPGRPFIGAQ